MPRYALTLPTQLKQEAERWATQQGVSLDQFILWALAEKVGSLSQQLSSLEKLSHRIAGRKEACHAQDHSCHFDPRPTGRPQ